MPTAYRYDIENGGKADGMFSLSPHWVVAVFPLDQPVTYSRTAVGSRGSVFSGALSSKASPYIITDDCVALTVVNNKNSHVQYMNAVLKQSDINYLTHIFPGDWVVAWMVYGESARDALVQNIREGKRCNDFYSGLKFFGRLYGITKNMYVTGDGKKVVDFSVQCVAFSEFNAMAYFNQALATPQSLADSLISQLAAIGIDLQSIMNPLALEKGKVDYNTEDIILSLIGIVLGRGLEGAVNTAYETWGAKFNIAPMPQSGRSPYFYLVPDKVGRIIGVSKAWGDIESDRAKYGEDAAYFIGYADLLQVISGIQSYGNSAAPNRVGAGFWPDVFGTERWKQYGKIRIYRSDYRMMGSTIPTSIIALLNQPVWQLIQQNLNTVINEAYTCLRTNDMGDILPTVVLRQIPFTSSAYSRLDKESYTPFLSLPRWCVDRGIVFRMSVSRSDATRCNLVHVLPDPSLWPSNDNLTTSTVKSPPIIDGVDVFRSGIRPFSATVPCGISDVNEIKQRIWTRLAADWMMGSHLTLSGEIETIGIQAPIVHGDNLEVDGVIYHIESVVHSCQVSADGKRSWRTVMRLTNGVMDPVEAAEFPVYPGLRPVKYSGNDIALQREPVHPNMDPGFGGDKRMPDPPPADNTVYEYDTSAPAQYSPAGIEKVIPPSVENNNLPYVPKG